MVIHTRGRRPMKTVRMTLDDDLVEDVDRVVSELHITRSAFARNALTAAVRRHREALLDEKHRRGYKARPVTAQEFGVWEEEREWGDSWSEARCAGAGSPSPTGGGRS
jgi:predicted transcriptional regulator